MSMSDEQKDPINPSHYRAYKGLEVIQLTEQMNFNRGNAVKYICRAGLKDPSKEIEDLEKAVWYLQREIDRLKGGLQSGSEMFDFLQRRHHPPVTKDVDRLFRPKKHSPGSNKVSLLVHAKAVNLQDRYQLLALFTKLRDDVHPDAFFVVDDARYDVEHEIYYLKFELKAVQEWAVGHFRVLVQRISHTREITMKINPYMEENNE